MKKFILLFSLLLLLVIPSICFASVEDEELIPKLKGLAEVKTLAVNYAANIKEYQKQDSGAIKLKRYFELKAQYQNIVADFSDLRSSIEFITITNGHLDSDTLIKILSKHKNKINKDYQTFSESYNEIFAAIKATDTYSSLQDPPTVNKQISDDLADSLLSNLVTIFKEVHEKKATEKQDRIKNIIVWLDKYYSPPIWENIGVKKDEVLN